MLWNKDYSSMTLSSSYTTSGVWIVGSGGLFTILGMGLPPILFLFFNEAVGAKSDFRRIDLKSKGPASSSACWQIIYFFQ